MSVVIFLCYYARMKISKTLRGFIRQHAGETAGLIFKCIRRMPNHYTLIWHQTNRPIIGAKVIQGANALLASQVGAKHTFREYPGAGGLILIGLRGEVLGCSVFSAGTLLGLTTSKMACTGAGTCLYGMSLLLQGMLAFEVGSSASGFYQKMGVERIGNTYHCQQSCSPKALNSIFSRLMGYLPKPVFVVDTASERVPAAARSVSPTRGRLMAKLCGLRMLPIPGQPKSRAFNAYKASQRTCLVSSDLAAVKAYSAQLGPVFFPGESKTVFSAAPAFTPKPRLTFQY